MYLDEVLVKFRRHPESATVLSLKDMSFVADSFRLFEQYAQYVNEPGKTPELVHAPLMEGLVRKVNNAIYDRKIDLSGVIRARTADGGGEAGLDFEKIAFQFLVYASQLKLQLEEQERLLKKKDEELKKLARVHTDIQGEGSGPESHSQLQEELTDLNRQLNELKNSSSWRITQPLRWLARTLQ